MSFEFGTQELEMLNEALEEKIEFIINSSDFDAFKEIFQDSFPQYRSIPVDYKGITYYPYSKGGQFPLDLLFESLVSYKKLVELHLKENSSFKHYIK